MEYNLTLSGKGSWNILFGVPSLFGDGLNNDMIFITEVNMQMQHEYTITPHVLLCIVVHNFSGDRH